MLRIDLACVVFGLFATTVAQAMTLDVHDYGAVSDGQTDCTAAFQKALNDAAKDRGSVVYARKGDYLIAGTIVVRPHTTLAGDYSGPATGRGTCLLATAGKDKTDGRGCIYMQGTSTVRNVMIRYPEQSADAQEPLPYPYAITMDGYTRLEDVCLLNPYLGINMDGAHANLVRNVWGEPLRVGINSDHVHDISRIENVHFWPYFTNGKRLREWVQQHGVAFQFGRSDWQYCVNTFSYGYHTGYRFYRSQDVEGTPLRGGTTNGNFVGIGADRCVIGIDIEDSFNIGVSVTNGEFAPFGARDARGVYLRRGNTGNLTLVNCNFWAVPNIIAEVQDGSLSLVACNIHEWAVTAKEQPAFILSGGRLNVNGCTFNKGGLLATIAGGKTRAIFSGNMGTEALTVRSTIGDRLVIGANNPEISRGGGST